MHELYLTVQTCIVTYKCRNRSYYNYCKDIFKNVLFLTQIFENLINFVEQKPHILFSTCSMGLCLILKQKMKLKKLYRYPFNLPVYASTKRQPICSRQQAQKHRCNAAERCLQKLYEAAEAPSLQEIEVTSQQSFVKEGLIHLPLRLVKLSIDSV